MICWVGSFSIPGACRVKATCWVFRQRLVSPGGWQALSQRMHYMLDKLTLGCVFKIQLLGIRTRVTLIKQLIFGLCKMHVPKGCCSCTVACSLSPIWGPCALCDLLPSYFLYSRAAVAVVPATPVCATECWHEKPSRKSSPRQIPEGSFSSLCPLWSLAYFAWVFCVGH